MAFLGPLLGAAAPYLRLVALAVACALLGYCGGERNAKAEIRAELAELEARHARDIADVTAAAFDRGLAAARAEAENQRTQDEISDLARREPGAGDLCLSADVLDGLRSLQ